MNEKDVLRDGGVSWKGNRLHLNHGLLTDNNRVVVEYANDFNHGGEGFHQFIDESDKNEYLYTNFCPYEAHRLFPCFDQPNLKGSLTLSVLAPSDWVVIGNSPTTSIKEVEGEEDESRKLHTFEKGPQISTYVFAVIAGPFHVMHSEYKSKREPERCVPLAIYCRKSKVPVLQSQFEPIFDLTKSGLDFFQDFFDYNFPFTKYDQIFCPEFNWGAMENVGAVIFSESHILPANTTENRHSQRASTLLHEMAHMWFGNLVTPAWWDGLWLNESFATYLGSLAVSRCTPYTTTWMWFHKRSKQTGYKADTRITTHPIQPSVPDTEHTFLNFDGITYGKGASVLKQLISFLGLENFRLGLVQYFRNYAWGNTSLKQFLDAVTSQTKTDCDWARWGHDWLQTCGVNTLKIHYTQTDSKITSFEIHQTPQNEEHNTLRLHHTKIAIFTQHPTDHSLVFHGPFDVVVQPQAITVIDPKVFESFCGSPVFIYPNYEDEGYFRTVLDPLSLQFLLSEPSNILKFKDPLLRLTIWDDLYNMTTSCQLQSSHFLNLLRNNLPNENDLTILQAMIDALVTCLQFYVPSKFIDIEADKSFSTILDILVNLESEEPILTLKPALHACCISSACVSQLQQSLNDPIQLTKLCKPLQWDMNDKWKIIGRCVAKGFEGSLDLVHATAEIDQTDRGRRALATALSSQPDADNKAKLWEYFLDQNNGINHATQVAEMAAFRQCSEEFLRPYHKLYFENILQAFTNLPKKTAVQWAICLYPFDPENQSIIEQTRHFLAENKDLEHVIQRIIMERLDDLLACQAARNFYSS